MNIDRDPVADKTGAAAVTQVRAGDTLDLSRIGGRFRIKKTATETAGQSLEMEMDLLPHSGGTPLHIHPFAEESYDVLQGTFEVNIGGVWKTAAAGERVVVTKGVAHTFRNTSNETVTVYNAHRPAMKFGEYFARLHKLANSDAVRSQKMTLKTILHLSMLMATYPDEIRSVNPPAFVVSVLATFGRLLRYEI